MTDPTKIAAGPPEWRKECPYCEGEGKVDRRDLPLHHLHSEAPEYTVTHCGECDGKGWFWTDKPVPLDECPPGPFWFDGSLGFKTEYGMTMPNGMGVWTVTNWPEAYCMSSGEVFWGGTSTHETRSALLVWPVEEVVPAVRAILQEEDGGD